MRRLIIFILYLGILGGLCCCQTESIYLSIPQEKKAEKIGGQQEIDEIRFKDYILKLNFVLETGLDKNEKFNSPYGIAVDDDGNVYVAETRNHRIQVFSNNGEFIKSFGREGKKSAEFSVPIDIAFYKNNLYIAEFENKRIQILSNDGTYVDSFEIPFSPDQIAVNDNNIYISERFFYKAKYLLHKYSRNGQFVTGFGETKNTGNFDNNTINNRINLFPDSDGCIYVAWMYLPKLRKYSLEGKLLAEFEYQPTIKNRKKPLIPYITYNKMTRISSHESWTRMGGGTKEYPICYDMAVDSKGTINLLIAADHDKIYGTCAIYQFDPSGNLLGKTDLPIICEKIYIDSRDNFYFASPIETKLVYKYSKIRAR